MTMNIELTKRDRFNFIYQLTHRVLTAFDEKDVPEVGMFFNAEESMYIVNFRIVSRFVKRKGIFDCYIKFGYKDMQAYLNNQLYPDELFKKFKPGKVVKVRDL